MSRIFDRVWHANPQPCVRFKSAKAFPKDLHCLGIADVLNDVLCENAVPVVVWTFPRTRHVKIPIRAEAPLTESALRRVVVGIDPSWIVMRSTAQIEKLRSVHCWRASSEHSVADRAFQAIENCLKHRR